MVLDEPKLNDIVHTLDGFTFVMDKDVAGFTGDVTLDATSRGFVVNSGLNRGRTYGCSK
jgi:hypothetical protein